jgi:hypothetical protein
VIISLKSCIHNKKNYDLCITATLYKIKESMKDSLCPPSWAVVDRKKKWRRRMTVRNGTPAGRLPHQSPGVTSPLTCVHTEGSLADKHTEIGRRNFFKKCSQSQVCNVKEGRLNHNIFFSSPQLQVCNFLKKCCSTTAYLISTITICFSRQQRF